MTRVSVCMAAFDGHAFIREQIASILDELSPDDELIVVDDASRDDTRDLVAAVADDRVRLHVNPVNRGYVSAFERAIGLATGDVVFLADQDDVWIPGRRKALLEGLATHAVVASNLVLHPDGAALRSPLTGRPWRLATTRQPRRNILRILVGDAPYFGCAMAFRRTFAEVALPFPPFLVESHDLWLALVGNAGGSLGHVAAPTVQRRLHESNASPRRPRGIRRVLAARLMLLRCLVEARRRVRRARAGR